jgi:ribosomal protein S18 acetylase RimI-like enzyme
MIRIAKTSDAYSVAKIHQRTLTKSFLSNLGLDFLESLYKFLLSKELVIVYEDANGISGFVSYSSNSSGMMSKFLITCPACIIKLFGILITSPGKAQRFIETFKAPFKSKTAKSSKGIITLPSAELLSISVDTDCQAKGVGGQLLQALEDYLKQKGITQYKVIAGVELESANSFYAKNGFVLVNQIVIHGNSLSNVYVKTL